MKQLHAPQVEKYLSILEHEYRLINCFFSYDDRTYHLIDQIFEALRVVAPVNEYGSKNLWIHTDRGTLDDYGKFEDAVEYGDVETKEQFEQNWLAEYPDEEYWYHFHAVEDPQTGYKAIFVARRFIFEVDPSKKRSAPYDASEFAEWLLEQVRACIREIKDGTYLEYVDQHLPLEHRTGTILRKDLWEVLPETREEDLSGLDLNSIRQFLDYAKEGNMPIKYYPSFTANEFFHCCSLGYQANHYPVDGLTPREQYYRNADGRDNGLKKIDPDDPEAFKAWITDRTQFGGHPWEVCRGGNSTHISLYVHYQEEGYRLILSGSSIGRYAETINFYLALRQAGYSVELTDMDILSDRLCGKEKIGIVPDGIFPRYCSEWFPGENVISFMNLPYEDREKIVPKCVWQPLEPVVLVDDKKT